MEQTQVFESGAEDNEMEQSGVFGSGAKQRITNQSGAECLEAEQSGG